MIKRPHLSRRKAAPKELAELTSLAIAFGQSCCRIEDKFWEQRLSAEVQRLLQDKDEASLSLALDQLFGKDDHAYGALIDTIESCVESLASDGATPLDVVLIAMPILAWSRYQVPSGKLSAAALDTLRVQLQAHVLGKDTKLSLIDVLFSPDQLPASYVDTHELLKKLEQPVLHNKNLSLDPRQLPETAHFLSDTRYLIGAIAAPIGIPLFRWQEADGSRNEALKQWQNQGHEAIRPLLPACAFELLPPGAYHSAIRDADRSSRAYSLKAAIDFLKTITGLPASGFQASIGAHHNRQLEEYRIGLSFAEHTEVLHGVVWPILDASDESPDAVSQIEALLKDAGLLKVTVHAQQLPMEYCDDCGAPLFPNPEGELMHAELPEELGNSQPQQLH